MEREWYWVTWSAHPGWDSQRALGKLHANELSHLRNCFLIVGTFNIDDIPGYQSVSIQFVNSIAHHLCA
jgi:hypothetical protein